MFNPMKFLPLALVLITSCSSAQEKLLAPTKPAALTSREDVIPLTVTTDKVKGQTIVTVTWDTSLVRTAQVAMQRQNQSVDPVFVTWYVPNTGTFTDTLPKGKPPVTHYYYWLCEWPGVDTNGDGVADDARCAVDWTPAL